MSFMDDHFKIIPVDTVVPGDPPSLFVYDVMVEVVRTVSAATPDEAQDKVEREIDAMPHLQRVGNTTRVTPGSF